MVQLGGAELTEKDVEETIDVHAVVRNMRIIVRRVAYTDARAPVASFLDDEAGPQLLGLPPLRPFTGY